MLLIERYELPAPYCISKHSTGLLHVWYEENGKWVTGCGRIRSQKCKPDGHNRFTEGDMDSTCEICGRIMRAQIRWTIRARR